MRQQAIRRQREAVRFCCLFGLYTLLTFLALYALHDRLVVPFTRRIAWLSHQALKTMGAQSWVAGASYENKRFIAALREVLASR